MRRPRGRARKASPMQAITNESDGDAAEGASPAAPGGQSSERSQGGESGNGQPTTGEMSRSRRRRSRHSRPAGATRPFPSPLQETGSLGLRLIWEPSSSRLTLKGVHEGTQAERHPQLRGHLAQGLLLRSVGGEDVVGKSYEESIASLRTSSRPLTVTFDLVGPEDDEGAG